MATRTELVSTIVRTLYGRRGHEVHVEVHIEAGPEREVRKIVEGEINEC